MLTPNRYRQNYKDRTGEIINGIEILYDDVTRTTSGNVMWLYKCYCGKQFHTRYHRLKTGITQSCGCYQKQKLSEMSSAATGVLHHNWNPNLIDEDRLYNRDVHF